MGILADRIEKVKKLNEKIQQVELKVDRPTIN